MANVTESASYDSGVYRIETTDPVVGGETGIANKGIKNLANRTKYLKARINAGTALGCGQGALKRVTHNLNIPVENQVITLTVSRKNSGTKTFSDLHTENASSPIPVLQTCNHSVNYFDIFYDASVDYNDVDWILYDTR